MTKTLEQRGEQAWNGVWERVKDSENDLGFQDQADECLLAAADAGLPVKVYIESVYNPSLPIAWTVLRP